MIYHESYYSKSPLESHHKNTLLLGRGGFFDNWPPVGAPQSELEGDLDVDVTDGKWHHAAYVKETSNDVTVMFYLDGKLAATKDWERYTGKATTQNLIGGHRLKYRDGEANAFDGFMWDLYVWLPSQPCSKTLMHSVALLASQGIRAFFAIHNLTFECGFF